MRPGSLLYHLLNGSVIAVAGVKWGAEPIRGLSWSSYVIDDPMHFYVARRGQRSRGNRGLRAQGVR